MTKEPDTTLLPAAGVWVTTTEEPSAVGGFEGVQARTEAASSSDSARSTRSPTTVGTMTVVVCGVGLEPTHQFVSTRCPVEVAPLCAGWVAVVAAVPFAHPAATIPAKRTPRTRRTPSSYASADVPHLPGSGAGLLVELEPSLWTDRQAPGRYHRLMHSGGRSTIKAFVGLIALALVGCSCSVSVSVGSFDPQKATYDKVWNAGWTNIARDERPFGVTSSSPGVCNVGGSQKGCFDTDQALISDYQSFGRALTNAPVPRDFIRADATVHQAIAAAIKGLEERNALIANPTPSGTFAQSNQDLRRSDELFMKGIKQYTGNQVPVNPYR